MAGPLYDCYVLAPERNAEWALRLLNRFVPAREPCFDPSDPVDVLGLPVSSSVEDALRYLERNITVAYSMYWRNLDHGEPRHAMLSFNADGSLVVGLSVADDDSGDLPREYLGKLKDFAGTKGGLFLFEHPPPLSREEFEKMARQGASG